MARTAIVTGAGRGIGRGIAVALGAAGWRVIVNYARDEEAAMRTAREVERAGGSARTVQADIARTEDRSRLVEQSVEQFGPIHLLVNNAGITSPDRDKDLLDDTEDGFDQLMAVNLKGPHFLTQLVARHMIGRPVPDEAGSDAAPRGTVINISSLSAYAVSVNRGDYCMAKAAMGMMTRAWAVRLAPHGIGVYELRPGVIESDMTAPVRQKYDRLIHEEGLLPIARWGRPEDVGRVVVMLAEGTLAYSTGEVINIDGGFHIRRL